MKRFMVLILVIVLLVACTIEKDEQKDLIGESVSENLGPIYFVSRAEQPEGEIYCLDKDDGIKRLTYNERHENNVALSFDGNHLAYHAGEESDFLSYEIYTMNLQDGTETQWTNNRLLDGHPDWSPDGKQLIYASFDDGYGNPYGTADLYMLNLETGNKKRLTENPGEDNDPEISPDGKWISFKSTRHTESAGKEEIFVMSIEGEDIRRLTTVKGWQSDHDPSWSSDSNKIVFERFEGTRIWTDIGVSDILISKNDELTPWNNYMVDLDGNLTKLTDVEQGQITFLPVFNHDNLMYTHITFIEQDGNIIGASKVIKMLNPYTGETIPYLDDEKHKYSIEYFDW